MARRRVGGPEESPKESAEARTPPIPGTIPDPADVEKEIARHQDDAIARTIAKNQAAKAEAPASLGAGFFGAPGQPPTAAGVQREREAKEMKARLEEIEATKAKASLEERAVKPTAIDRMNGAEGDEVTATHGPELYGKPNTFSTYTVGPFTSRTRVLPGETRQDAHRRLLAELREVANDERDKAHAEFAAHFMTKVVGVGQK